MRIDPYRWLFPCGLTFALAGALVWPLHALGLVAYPGLMHRALMMEGFELSFVLGFLLTAMPGFTRAARCHPVELALALATVIVSGALRFAGQDASAHLVAALAVAVLVVALARRTRAPGFAAPEEFLFVAFGLAAGLLGTVLLAAEATGRAWTPPGFPMRLLSLGMVMALVLGIGGLLVPAFGGVPRPLEIQGVAPAHARAGRRPLVAGLVTGLAASFALDAIGWTVTGAWLRVAVAAAALVLLWKAVRRGTHATLHAHVLRASGWAVLAGLAGAALAPAHAVAGEHIVFLGGYGLLTLAIASRVVVAHGGHPAALEARLTSPLTVGAIVLALALRIGAEFMPRVAPVLLGASGTLWTMAWLAWGWTALPLIARRGERLVKLSPPGAPC